MKTWQIFFCPPKGQMVYSGFYVISDDYEQAILDGYEAARDLFGKTYDKNHLDAVRNYDPSRTPQEGWSPWTAFYAFDPVSQEHEIAQTEASLCGKEARAIFNLWQSRLPHQIIYLAQLTFAEARKQGLRT